jgi:LPS sulfotransferase NodH
MISMKHDDRSFVICATPRSGSTLLCEVLGLAGAGRPDEHLLPWYRDGSRRLAQPDLDRIVVNGTANRVFGLKVMWRQLETLAGALSAVTGVENPNQLLVLDAAFPNSRYIEIVRTDTVRQAVSMAKAIRSGDWERRVSLSASSNPANAVASVTAQNDVHRSLTYDQELIAWCYRRVQDDRRSWTSAFASAGIEPRRIEYEQLAAGYEAVAGCVLEYLGLPAVDHKVFAQLEMQRQSDAINEEWAERFRNDVPNLA